jgi:hypothetical protein
MGGSQLVAVPVLFLPAVAGELAWRWIRGRHGRRRWFPGVGAAVGILLVAASVAIGITNETLGGYPLFAIGVASLVILMTAYYAWRARAIAFRWWQRSRAGNDQSRT